MPDYLFDMKLQAAITVTATTREEAEAELTRILDCADTNFGAFKSGAPALGETSLITETLRLGQVDGEEYTPSEDESWINCALDNSAEFYAPDGKNKYWCAEDTEEECWRVDQSDQCETKADAARVYCESYGCEP